MKAMKYSMIYTTIMIILMFIPALLILEYSPSKQKIALAITTGVSFGIVWGIGNYLIVKNTLRR